MCSLSVRNKELKIAVYKTNNELQHSYEKNRYLEHEIGNYLAEINTLRKQVNNQMTDLPSYDNSNQVK